VKHAETSVIRERALASQGGFTLIEVLVVIAIISILAGLSLVGIQKGREYGERHAVKADVTLLTASIRSFRNAWGDFPPTSLAGIRVSGNSINDGNESLFAFLLTQKHGGPFADGLPEDRWFNADLDVLTPAQRKTVLAEIQWVRGNDDLLEHVDFWGNPYVYIHSRDYGTSFRYSSRDGEPFTAQAGLNPATGLHFAPTTFQLWSLGVDGINQNGGGDDIVSWE
jgi:prepilin-type N-terminal cleavage/methylation domain-containing protein